MSIVIIAAHDDNRVIGNGDKLPWYAPDDLAYFKQMTLGRTMVIGRKTFDSIGKPLPGRETIVLTKDANWHYNSVEICTDYMQLVQQYSNTDDILFVAGGSEIYKLFLDYADTVLITHIHGEYEGDVFFPEYEDRFKCMDESSHKDARTSVEMTFKRFTQ